MNAHPQPASVAAPGPDTAISTGYPNVDALTGGLAPGTVTLLAGRSEILVQRLAFNVLAHVALRQRVPTLLVEPPVGDTRAYATMFACAMGISLAAALEPAEDEAEFEFNWDGEEIVRDAPWSRCTDATEWLPGWQRLRPPDERLPRPSLLVVGPLTEIDARSLPGYDPAWSEAQRGAALCRALRSVAATERLAVLAYATTADSLPDWFSELDAVERCSDEDAREFEVDCLILVSRMPRDLMASAAALDDRPVELRVARGPSGRRGGTSLRYEREKARFTTGPGSESPWDRSEPATRS